MEQNEILELVVHAIYRAQRICNNETHINLNRSEANGLMALSQEELLQILNVLEKNYNAIKIVYDPTTKVIEPFKSLFELFKPYITREHNYWGLEVLPGFAELIKKYPVRTKLVLPPRVNKIDNNQEIWLVLRNEELYIDGKYFIARVRYNQDNHRAIEYIIENSNRDITCEELRKKTFVSKQFSVIIDQLNLKGDLRKAFFDVTKSTIHLHNPITRERLDSLGIKHIQFRNSLRRYKRIRY